MLLYCPFRTSFNYITTSSRPLEIQFYPVPDSENQDRSYQRYTDIRADDLAIAGPPIRDDPAQIRQPHKRKADICRPFQARLLSRLPKRGLVLLEYPAGHFRGSSLWLLPIASRADDPPCHAASRVSSGAVWN